MEEGGEGMIIYLAFEVHVYVYIDIQEPGAIQERDFSGISGGEVPSFFSIHHCLTYIAFISGLGSAVYKPLLSPLPKCAD